MFDNLNCSLEPMSDYRITLTTIVEGKFTLEITKLPKGVIFNWPFLKKAIFNKVFDVGPSLMDCFTLLFK